MKARNNGLYGYHQQLSVLKKILVNSLHHAYIVMVIGPSGTGKSTLLAYLKTIAPGDFEYISCNQLATQGLFQAKLAEIRTTLENQQGNKRPRFWVLDEVDVVAVRREQATIGTVTDVQRVMALADSFKQSSTGVLFLCTNCPGLIDQAVASRVDEFIYVPYPGETELHDALVDGGIPPRKAGQIVKIWLSNMAANG
jgi:AAA+ superfamily predicted ATPase